MLASMLLIMDIFRHPAEVFSIMKMAGLQIQISLIHQRLCIRLTAADWTFING